MKIDSTKKRLILVDLDGTALKNDGKTLHPKTKQALIKAQEGGHIVCIVTGRPVRAAIQYYNELKLNTLLTNFDGAHISDPIKREFKRLVFPINYEIIMEILNDETINKSIENIMLESYDRVLIWKKDENLENFFHLNEIEKIGIDTLIVGNPWEFWKGSSTNIVLKLKGEKYLHRVIRSLAKFQDAVKIQSDVLYGIKSVDKEPIITLTNKNVDKGFAAEILAQYYNKDIRDVIAFGDQLNDFEMLRKVGVGIAMQNGASTLKFIANGITHKTNDDGGVGDYIQRLLKGEEY
ncbi:HAD-IIB family hydrolase [Williamsoniiplasma luminosum]|uniref:Cof-type HAD-IIB family hydrolase n=1 Tax=Williamsoniiplasma luminosum TaxID=214888 RepID=A0A2S0NKX2_9MOLU|nr:HAD-IIB family hydrolase [Williamsoniiplasma luminosum]AVP49657.1 MAG: Cof-type HAD-IIB family hydrolase [Williamsoniiplasma luminosum]